MVDTSLGVSVLPAQRYMYSTVKNIATSVFATMVHALRLSLLLFNLASGLDHLAPFSTFSAGAPRD